MKFLQTQDRHKNWIFWSNFELPLPPFLKMAKIGKSKYIQEKNYPLAIQISQNQDSIPSQFSIKNTFNFYANWTVFWYKSPQAQRSEGHS